MRSDARIKAGSAEPSVAERLRQRAAVVNWVALAALTVALPALAETMYKYRGESGEWIYADRPPDDGSLTEALDVESTEDEGKLSVSYSFEGQAIVLVANNGFYAPIEMSLEFQQIRGMQYPHPDNELRWVLPPRSEIQILSLPLLETAAEPLLEYSYRYLAGDPQARHRPPGPYRAPFAVATNHPVTQAFPQVATHTTPDSHYAVDLSMPIGTDIFAARAGVVFDVASTNFSGGLDPRRDGPKANVVRILHDVVRRGQYIADSGNTGFSSGPHLHFAVVRNAGMRIESVPVSFLGQNSATVIPATGSALTAY